MAKQKFLDTVGLVAAGSVGFGVGGALASYFIARRYGVKGYFKMLTPQVDQRDVLRSPFTFPLVPLAELKRLFEAVHQANEQRYNGDGSWGHGAQDAHNFDPVKVAIQKGEHRARIGTRPLLRHSAWNAAAYTLAWSQTKNDIFRQRALSAAAYLLSQQRPEGYFPYFLEEDVLPTMDQAGVQLESGWCVAHLACVYRTFKDEAILDAVNRAAWWALRTPSTQNYNYRANVVWLLVEAYRLTHNEEWLYGAIQILKKDILADQMPDGGWWFHNSHVWYHSYILKALAALRAVLPAEHEFYPRLSQATYAATNLVIRRQLRDGSLIARRDPWVRSTLKGQPHSAIEAFSMLYPCFGEKLNTPLRGMISDLGRWVEQHPLSVFDAKRKTYSMVLDSHLLALALAIEIYPQLAG